VAEIGGEAAAGAAITMGIFDRLGRGTQDRLAELERAVRKLGEAGRDRATTIDARLEELIRAVGEQPTAKDLRELRQALRGVAAPQPAPSLFETIDQIAASGRPVLIGPWTGEVGFELLYWIPFIEWLRARWQLSPDREVIVSRGGVVSWYGQSADRYVDILSLFSADEFRAAVAEEKRKHRRPGAFDERVTEAVVRQRALGDVDVLHPGLMFRAFAPYWSDEAGYALIDQFTRPRLLERPAETLRTPLPPDYVAVRFYFSECFPATPENRQFARNVVSSLAERTPVVMLNPGVAVDEHTDWMPDSRDRIISIGDGLTPERNLGVQSAVIAGARAFVGTYGGYSYLAPLYKVPAVAFYSRPSFKLHHLHAAQRAFAQIDAAALMPIDVAQASLVQGALGALVAA
jgi:hypothetical protein